jgi:hypothetical protein
VRHSDETGEPKANHREVDYREGHEHCAICTMFREPASCTAVVDPISPDGLCDLFEHADEAPPALAGIMRKEHSHV